MQRIDTSTAATSEPLPAEPGTPGYFTNGNPATGTAATIVDQDWLNAIQDEIINVILAAAVTPVKGTNNQLLAAVRKLLGTDYIKSGVSTILPSQLIIQTFGTPSVQLGAANVEVSYNYTFPVAFPNGVISLSGIDGANACINWNAFGAKTLTGGTGYVYSTVAGTAGAPATGSLTALGW